MAESAPQRSPAPDLLCKIPDPVMIEPDHFLKGIRDPAHAHVCRARSVSYEEAGGAGCDRAAGTLGEYKWSPGRSKSGTATEVRAAILSWRIVALRLCPSEALKEF